MKLETNTFSEIIQARAGPQTWRPEQEPSISGIGHKRKIMKLTSQLNLADGKILFSDFDRLNDINTSHTYEARNVSESCIEFLQGAMNLTTRGIFPYRAAG